MREFEYLVVLTRVLVVHIEELGLLVLEFFFQLVCLDRLPLQLPLQLDYSLCLQLELLLQHLLLLFLSFELLRQFLARSILALWFLRLLGSGVFD